MGCIVSIVLSIGHRDISIVLAEEIASGSLGFISCLLGLGSMVTVLGIDSS